MGILRDHEIEAVRILVRGQLDNETLAAVLADATFVSCEHTGVGYFLKLKHPSIPVQRVVCDEPLIVGTAQQVECGFVVFLEGGELTLECHGWGTPLPEDLRDRPITIAPAPQ